jgi:hypothetical protein
MAGRRLLRRRSLRKLGRRRLARHVRPPTRRRRRSAFASRARGRRGRRPPTPRRRPRRERQPRRRRTRSAGALQLASSPMPSPRRSARRSSPARPTRTGAATAPCCCSLRCRCLEPTTRSMAGRTSRTVGFGFHLSQLGEHMFRHRFQGGRAVRQISFGGRQPCACRGARTMNPREAGDIESRTRTRNTYKDRHIH